MDSSALVDCEVHGSSIGHRRNIAAAEQAVPAANSTAHTLSIFLTELLLKVVLKHIIGTIKIKPVLLIT